MKRCYFMIIIIGGLLSVAYSGVTSAETMKKLSLPAGKYKIYEGRKHIFNAVIKGSRIATALPNGQRAIKWSAGGTCDRSKFPDYQKSKISKSSKCSVHKSGGKTLRVFRQSGALRMMISGVGRGSTVFKLQ